MAKTPKFQISFLGSMQICRPKDPSSLVKTPLPYVSTTLNHSSKSYYDISLPSFRYHSPPSTPNYISTKSNASSKSCINMHDDEFTYSRTRNDYDDDKEKLYNHSRFSSDSSPLLPIDNKKEKAMIKRSPKASFSLADSNDDSLFSDSNSPLRITDKEKEKRSSVRTQRFKRYGSKDWSMMATPENESLEQQKPVSCRRSSVDGKSVINQGLVVVKRSVDPYEDFKKSMLEMILEQKMFEPEELEHLLMSFLSLNSRLHHRAILKAFTEIWKEVFFSG